MKKLILYCLSSILLITVFACKHSSKKDTPQTPTNSKDQSKVLTKEEIASTAVNVPAKVTKQEQENITEAIKNSENPNIQGSNIENVENLAISSNDEELNNKYVKIKFTYSPNQKVVYQIYNKNTGELYDTVYSNIDNPVKENGKYAIRVQIDESALNEPGKFKILDGDLKSVLKNDSKYALISKYESKDFTYFSTSTNKKISNKRQFAMAESYDGAVDFIGVVGDTFAHLARPNTLDFIQLFEYADGECGALSYELHEVSDGYNHYFNDTKEGFPVITPIKRIRNLSTATPTVLGEKTSCTIISKYLNTLDKPAKIEFTFGNKDPFIINY